MTIVNLNARIRVKLTPLGKVIYDRYWLDILDPEVCQVCPPSLKNGHFEGELWDFMHIFGRHLYNGCSPVTVGTDLTIVSPN